MGYAPSQGLVVNPGVYREIDDPEALADTGKVYTNDIAGRTELMYKDDTDAEVQITSAGGINPGAIDHGGLTGRGDDDHTQYALLAGRAGGQTLTGGTASGEDLTLEATSDASKGEILCIGDLAPDSDNGRNLGVDSPLVHWGVGHILTVAGDSGSLSYRLNVSELAFGLGAAKDIRLRRTGAGVLQVDDTSTGNATLTVVGNLRSAGADTAGSFLDLDDGSTVAVGAAGEVRFRSNAGVFEVSESAAAFAAVQVGAVDLTADVTGTLPVANGGTGVTSSTGTTNVVLSGSPTIVTPTIASFANAAHDHADAAGGGNITLTTGVTGTLPVANGGTGVTSSTGTTNVVLSGSPTIVTPTIVSFANAAHDHSDAAGGGNITLTTGVTGTLPVANGGTGVTSSTGTGNTVLSAAPTLSGVVTVTSGSVRADGTSGTAVAFFEMDDGATVTVGAAGEVRMRSNGGTFEVSENGGAFAAPGGGGTLDDAYDFGGAHLGRIVQIDAGFPIELKLDTGTVPSVDADVALVLFNGSAVSDQCELSIISGISGIAGINFGDTANEDEGQCRFTQSTGTFNFFVASATPLSFTATTITLNEGGAAATTRMEGDTLTHLLGTDGVATTQNIFMFASAIPNWQSMDQGIHLGDVATAPTGNPTAGVFVYVTTGAAQVRGGGGTVTEWGPSALHCEACGSDFWTVASLNMNWKSWCFICGVCGASYKGGPQDVLDQLTPQQNTELIRQTSTWDDVKKLMQLVA